MVFTPRLRSLCSLLLLGADVAVANPVSSSTSQRSGSSLSYDMPLTWNSYGFLTDIAMGTPAQNLRVFVDWTWIGQYEVTTVCNGDPKATYQCLNAQQQIWNQSLSSTFVNLTDQYGTLYWDPNHFFFYNPIGAYVGSDVNHIGPVEYNVTFQPANFLFDMTAIDIPFSGVFGLSPVFAKDNTSIQSPFYQAWKQHVWSTPLVAFHYCYNGSVDTNKATCQGHDGLQTLGGYNQNLVRGNITWYDIINFPLVNELDFIYSPAIYNYWALNLTSFSIGDEVQALNSTYGAAAIFDHASYGRGAPMSATAYQRLIQLSGATQIILSNPPNNGGEAFYQFPCNRTAQLPPLKYGFAGSDRVWEITPHNYVEPLGADACTLNVRVIGAGDMIIGNFGETFSKDKYILFDFDELKVGVADLNW